MDKQKDWGNLRPHETDPQYKDWLKDNPPTEVSSHSTDPKIQEIQEIQADMKEVKPAKKLSK